MISDQDEIVALSATMIPMRSRDFNKIEDQFEQIFDNAVSEGARVRATMIAMSNGKQVSVPSIRPDAEGLKIRKYMADRANGKQVCIPGMEIPGLEASRLYHGD